MIRLVAAFVVVAAAVAAATAALGAGTQSARVTLVVRPTSLGPLQNALVFGAVGSRRAGEAVKLQSKDCGLSTFRTVSLLETTAGGTFRQEFGAGVNTTLRAVWKGAASAPVALRQAPRVQLDRRAASRFEVGVGSQGRMWRKKVVFQRRVGSSWVTVKQVVLTDTYSTPGLGSGTWTEVEFRASVPAGSVVRAVLPIAEARPCYLPGLSNTVRT